MSENKVRVAVIDLSGKKYNTRLPEDVPAGQVVTALVRQLGLATEGPGGRTIRYGLVLNTAEGMKEVKEDETLAEAGVSDGSELRLTPEMTAGGLEVKDALL